MTALVYALLVLWLASVSVAAWREHERTERALAELEREVER